MVVVVASLASSSSRSLLSSSSKVGVFGDDDDGIIKSTAIPSSRPSRGPGRPERACPSRSETSTRTTTRTSIRSPPFSEYISDGSRILAVTFPDETRREQMTDTTWKVQVLCCVYTTYMECNVFRVFPSKRTFGETHTLNVEATA